MCSIIELQLQLWTDRGRSKALIRNALNESCLERYLLTWIYADNIKDFYEPYALLRDEKAEILPKLASDISCLLFAIPIDDPELNLQNSNKANVIMIEPVIESSTASSSSTVVKPRKINQIDSFNETTKSSSSSSSVEVNVINTPLLKSNKIINDIHLSEALETLSVDRFSINSENASLKEDEEEVLSHSTITSDDEEDVDTDEQVVIIEPKREETSESKNNDEEIIENQKGRIKELEQHIKDLTLENSRLRHMLNTNKINTAASFQVSIPRAVLQKSKTQNYYVYEINLKTTTGSENWTIFKRYRDFYKLHKNLKKEYLQIKILDFPPKKRVGNTNFDFVEDRRQRLQVYIRHVLQNLPELQVETRQLLESKCTFFMTS